MSEPTMLRCALESATDPCPECGHCGAHHTGGFGCRARAGVELRWRG